MIQFNKNTAPEIETFANQHRHHLLCWKSVFAGLAISFMSLILLSVLGMGVAGFSAESLINRNSEVSSTLVTMAGLWLGISVLVSLFCGAYFSLRISRFITNRIGAAHGFVIASLFFLLLVGGAGNILGGVARGLGDFAQVTAVGASALSSNPLVQDSMNAALGNTNLKSNPETVVSGLAARLMQGNTESAKAYYAYQTGLNADEVETKFAQMQTDFNIALKQASEKTARTVGDAGLTLFVLFFVGLIAALFGGRIGAQANLERPFVKPEPARHLNKIEPVHI